jgi:hypothetical protein
MNITHCEKNPTEIERKGEKEREEIDILSQWMDTTKVYKIYSISHTPQMRSSWSSLHITLSHSLSPQFLLSSLPCVYSSLSLKGKSSRIHSPLLLVDG